MAVIAEIEIIVIKADFELCFIAKAKGSVGYAVA